MSNLDRHILKYTSILIILLQFNILVKPFAPYIEYVINYDYISKVLCINQDKPEMKCDGKCHLKKQINKSAEESNDPQKTIIENRNDNFVFIIEQNFDLTKTISDQNSFNYISENYNQIFKIVPTPPPKYNC